MAKQPGMDRLLIATYEAEQRHFWFDGFRRFVRPILDEALGDRPAARMLDAGCGTGNNLALLAKYGRAFGIDTNAVGLHMARRRGLGGLSRASVTSLPFGTDTFDLVASFDVLYCLDDNAERSAISEMFRVLRPGGCLVVNVAAFEILRGGQSVLGGELRRFTKGQLRDHLQEGGFRIERITYAYASLFPLILLVRLGHRLTGLARRARESDLRVPAGPINRMLAALLAIEAALLQRVPMPFGSSVLCLARKPIAP